MVRHTYDPQLGSKQLVDHALARFSTDNLSCMLVRFDNKAVQQTVERRTEPIGVEGDPPSTKMGGISEADAIINEARKSMGDVGKYGTESEVLEDTQKGRFSQQAIEEEEEKEPGPELDIEGGINAAIARQKP